MKKIVLCAIASIAVSFASVDAQVVKSYEKPAEAEFRSAVKTLMYKTNGHDFTPERIAAMDVVQRMMNNFTTTEWNSYWGTWDWYEVDNMERFGVPYYLRQSFEKIKKEIKSTKVEKGSVAIWHLYNMGYIIKTPSQVLGIDLRAKRVDELMKFIDVGMITHSHGDHWAMAFVKALSKEGKPLLTNFNIKDVHVTRVKDGEIYEFGGIKIRTTIGDHNSNLKNFVVSYEIDCGEDTNHTVIYHTGDSCNYKQLNPQNPVDIFILHMAVGLKIQAAIDKIQPKNVFLSHLLELGHSITKWRWTYDDALMLRDKLEHDNVWIPVWGEKIVYKKSAAVK
ncbi:MAG: MBL fold metallo-hydrolase [Alistipes sp.]|nr:MBL fold metallo-hydrolase [Alistipes sp.]